MWGELSRAFQDGNVYLWCMVSISFLASMIIFERIISLYFFYSIDFSGFLNNLRKMIASKDLDRAMTFCRSVSKTSLPKIALLAIEAKDIDPTSVKGVIEEQTIEFVPKLEARISLLPMFATLVLLVGVLGTIDTLWWSFQSIDVLDTAKKQASLARGMAGALNPTALGLLAAMIIIFGHQITKNTALKVLNHTHHGIAVLYNLLVPSESVVTQVVSADAGSMSAGSDASDSAQSAPVNEDIVPTEDAFDDASVEDIKDEEEII